MMTDLIIIIQTLAMIFSGVFFLIAFGRMLLMRPLGLRSGQPTVMWMVQTFGMGAAMLWAIRDAYVLQHVYVVSIWGMSVRLIVLGWAISAVYAAFDPKRTWKRAVYRPKIGHPDGASRNG